jgi:uncharacterized protein YciI
MKLIPPRPTFAQDMTAEERAEMLEHVKYMRELFAAGKILIYGPVMAASGGYGMGVFEVENEEEARKLMEADPTMKSGLNKFELAPMRVGEARGI